jgi:hypothetical protein
VSKFECALNIHSVEKALEGGGVRLEFADDLSDSEVDGSQT